MRKRKAQQQKRRLLVCAAVLAVASVIALTAAFSSKGLDDSVASSTPPGASPSEHLSLTPLSSATGGATTPEPASIETEPELESLGEFTLTAYCPCVKCCGEWSAEHPSRVGTDYIQKTASGTIPTAGRTIGVDPTVIPFGTVVVINGHEYVAEDRGGAINGNKIDIFFEDHDEALEFGRQTAEVFIKNIKED